MQGDGPALVLDQQPLRGILRQENAYGAKGGGMVTPVYDPWSRAPFDAMKSGGGEGDGREQPVQVRKGTTADQGDGTAVVM
jgi:hypothetical protein